MNNLVVPISPGELVDKLTILELKTEYIKDPEKLNNINIEKELLEKVWQISNYCSFNIEKEYKELLEVNRQIWHIEDAIRDKERQKLFNKDFVDLARKQYPANDKRAQIKKEINIKLGSFLIEEKSYSSY